MQSQRQQRFRRNEQLENLLKDLNGLLAPAEEQALAVHQQPQLPVIFIVGCPRAGSTLALQWLANTEQFAYPTNLLSRFHGAPAIGARIQQLLTNPTFNFRNELFDVDREVTFESDLGKTQGALAPNEFWYFWRHFFDYGEIQVLDEEAFDPEQGRRFAAELAAVEAVFDQPLALKALIVNWNLPFVSQLLDRVLFLHVTRHPLYNAQSLLESRLEYFGNWDAWYSFKPPEYSTLSTRTPSEQVAGQVYFTDQAVRDGLRQIDSTKSLTVSYEVLCANPRSVYEQLREKLAEQDFELSRSYRGPDRFDEKNHIRLSQENWEEIRQAYEQFMGHQPDLD